MNSRVSIFLFSFYVVLFILAFNWLYSRNTEIFCHACPKTFNPRASDVISVLGEKWKQFSCVRVSQGNSLCNIISSRITNHTFFNDTFLRYLALSYYFKFGSVSYQIPLLFGIFYSKALFWTLIMYILVHLSKGSFYTNFLLCIE